jgi:hypothetical protein
MKPVTNMMEINMTLKDQLDAWKDGFQDGKEQILEFIRESTKQDFKDVADLIMWIRKQESKNETE